MFNWEGYVIENSTLVATEYPDGGGIPLELSIPLLIILFVLVIIGLVFDFVKRNIVKEEADE